MQRTLIAALATTLTALACTGCAAENPPPAPLTAAPESPPDRKPAADPGPLPPPDALTGVLDRLAAADVPGTDKLTLIQDGTPADAAALDGFARALRDGGFTPVEITAADIRWSDSHPGDVVASIEITGPGTPADPAGPGEFAFPMEFRRDADGWQLTRDTAEQLLAFGNARAGAADPSPPR